MQEAFIWLLYTGKPRIVKREGEKGNDLGWWGTGFGVWFMED